MQSSIRPLIASGLELRYGPIAIIGRALLRLEEILRRRDVFLSLESMDALLDINRHQADTWRPLIAIFDPRFNDLDATNSFALVGRQADGTVVATQAARFFDFGTSTFAAEATSLRLFYAKPALHRQPGETCDVTSLAARAISGRFVFSGAAWNAPHVRRTGLVQLLPRLCRLLALARWKPNTVATMMAAALVARGVHERVGYGSIEWGVHLRKSALGDLDLSLQWIKADDILPDVLAALEAFDRTDSVGEVEVPHHRYDRPAPIQGVIDAKA